MAFTHSLSTNNYGTSKIIVATSPANGTHITLASAMADAVSGDTIILRNSVTENVTLTAGVNIAAWYGSSLNTPTIIGKLTMTTAGVCNISGIKLQTNSDNILSVTGSAASSINLINCYLNCTTSTGIIHSSSSGSSALSLVNCGGDLATTGIAFHTGSSAGGISYTNCFFSNSGNSTAISNNSAGTVVYNYSGFSSPIGTTGTGASLVNYCQINSASTNTIAYTMNGSGINSALCSQFYGGSSEAITVASASGSIEACGLSSTGNNVVTGAGTLVNFQGNIYLNGGGKNVVTATAGGIYGSIVGTDGKAPTTGFLGEQISSSVSAVATTSSTPKSLTSISLTPGIWDISGIALATPTGGTSAMQAMALGIGTTNNTITGTGGIDFFQINAVSTTSSCAVPVIRATLTATTTYYLTVFNIYTSTSCPTNGRITATRVG